LPRVNGGRVSDTARGIANHRGKITNQKRPLCGQDPENASVYAAPRCGLDEDRGLWGPQPRYNAQRYAVFSDSSSLSRSVSRDAFDDGRRNAGSSGMISATAFFQVASCSSTGLNFVCVMNILIGSEGRGGLPILNFPSSTIRNGSPNRIRCSSFKMRALSDSSVSLSFHRDGGLQHDRAGVEIFIHKVDRATGEFYAVFERLALRFQARKTIGNSDG